MSKKLKILVGIIISVLIIGAASTSTYILRTTDPEKNEFTPANVTCRVEESFVNAVKSNVTVKNTGNVDAFIRAAIVITWENDKGEVNAAVPNADLDYTMTLGDGWIKSSDGFYYYPAAVAAGANTDKLIKTCTASDTAPEGYRLNVQILATALQADPPRAVENAWNVTVNGKTLTPN